MAIQFIIKRNGEVVSFSKDRIERAIEKAYIATLGSFNSSVVSSITETVLGIVENTFKDKIPQVEDIQNIVEREILNKGHFDVAKAYIIYREERARQREEKLKEVLERIEKEELKVTKRDGRVVPFDIREIEREVRNCANGYLKSIDLASIIETTKYNLFDGITTAEINKAVVMALKSYIERDPTYSFVAARFLINDVYRSVLGTGEFVEDFESKYRKGFIESIRKGISSGRLNKEMADFDLDTLSKVIDKNRDSLFQFMGIQTITDRYLLRDYDQNLLETPQYFWMRIAMGLALSEKKEERTKWAIEFYNTISIMNYIPSTPTLLHAGTNHPQMSSCYLSYATDDLHHIFKVIGDNAQLAKWSGGIGNDWTQIRATNALIKTINTGSQGLIPFLKIVDATTASINRSGKRRGATAVYLESWHMDIFDFLDLRKNTGDDRRRTHDINTVNWIPDLLVKRVMDDDTWTLFSPEEVPDLHEIYGKKFEERYVYYEKLADEGKIRLFKRIPAMQLWKKMVTMLFETGHPWMTFKDPSNIRSPQDHVGVVHNSNLCTEITLNTSKDETAVCNLGSINLVRHVKNGELDREMMAKTISVAVRMLDNVIDKNFYPVPEAENSNMKHRPIGLGIMGFQDLLYKINLPFDSEEAVRYSDEMMEFISYHAILNSSKLAKEKGAYSSFKGSKWDRGIFPVDTVKLLEEERGLSTDIDLISRMDWSEVKKHVKEYGMRNSNVMAIAPTATIANISGCLPSIEPIYKNIYVKSNFSGEFTVINGYFIEDMKRIDLWNHEMLEKVKYYDGNVSAIKEIPAYIRNKYKEVFQIDPIWILKHAAYRGKWIDQSQSINIFMNTTSGKFISDTYINAWKMGLKTTYYLRSLGASAIEKSTIDINKKYDEETGEATADTPEALALEEKIEEKENKEPVILATTVTETVSTATKPKVYVFEDDTCESCQ